MNTMLLSVLGLLALSSHAFGIVCTANYCEGVKCEPVKPEDCQGEFVKNGTMCGCCPACITILREGDNCASTLIRGSPPAAKCDKGLYCNSKTKKCEKPAK